MGNELSEIRTADGLLVVSPVPARRWLQLGAGAVMVGVPLARAIDGPGGLAPPAVTSWFMAFVGLAVLGQWLILQAVGEQLRKGLSERGSRPDGRPLSVHPTWLDGGRAGPALALFFSDRGAPFGWMPATPMHPAFERRAPFALAGEPVDDGPSLLRSRPAGQAIVGVIRPPEPAPPPRHQLAAHAEQLMGWAGPSVATLGGAHGFAPVEDASTGQPDPLLLRAATATQERLRTFHRVALVVAVIGVLLLTGNADGTAGLAVCLALVALSWTSRPLRRWADKPLVDQLVATTGLPVADARTLAVMLTRAGLGLISAGPPS